MGFHQEIFPAFENKELTCLQVSRSDLVKGGLWEELQGEALPSAITGLVLL